MKIRTWLFLILLAACAPLAHLARGQETNPRLSATRIKSGEAIVLVENDQRKDKVAIYTKVFKLEPAKLRIDPGARAAATLPDLIIEDVAMTKAAATNKQKWYVKIKNKGMAKSDACNLRFEYGMYLLDPPSLEGKNFAVPSIEAGKSTLIYFEPPHKEVRWWAFGVNIDTYHPQVKELTQMNNIYIIEMDTGEVFAKPSK